jgi:hypothetical protein
VSEPRINPEQLAWLQRAMLIDNNLPVSGPVNASTVDKRRRKKQPYRTQRALEISEHFADIINEAPNNPYAVTPFISLDDMTHEIRFRMGTGTITWLLIRWIALPIIEWLWRRYFTSAQPLTST